MTVSPMANCTIISPSSQGSRRQNSPSAEFSDEQQPRHAPPVPARDRQLQQQLVPSPLQGPAAKGGRFSAAAGGGRGEMAGSDRLGEKRPPPPLAPGAGAFSDGELALALPPSCRRAPDPPLTDHRRRAAGGGAARAVACWCGRAAGVGGAGGGGSACVGPSDVLSAGGPPSGSKAAFMMGTLAIY